jgi:hypothetical protein
MNRMQYLQMIEAGIDAGEHRFVRTASLSWLAAYPGDLQVSLYYAQAQIGEKRYAQARSTLDGICAADPEFLEAALARLQAEMGENGRLEQASAAAALALTGELPAHDPVYLNLTGISPSSLKAAAPDWTFALVDARRLLAAGDPERAQAALLPALAAGPLIPLVGVVHLRLVEADGPRLARLNLAELYHQRWPACLPISLMLAQWLADSDEGRAVGLLHSAAVNDVGGQAAVRLWGGNHPYQALWPGQLELTFDEPIPASVAGRLGMNLLDPGRQPSFHEPGRVPESLPQPKFLVEEMEQEPDEPVFYIYDEEPESEQPVLEGAVTSPEPVCEPEAAPAPVEVSPAPEAPVDMAAALPRRAPFPPSVIQERREIKRIAKRMGRPDLVMQDGRYPIYVILSTRRGLESTYGPEGAALVETILEDLLQAVQSRPRWGGCLFLVDEPSCTQPFDIHPARPDDPWSIKLALADLDAALANKGERIGAVLIVGGHEVVPFHYLPNPVDDDDEEIASDNPYSTRDENYLAPEWPVGRLPGGSGREPGLLIGQIERSLTLHRKAAPPASRWLRLWLTLRTWLRPPFVSEFTSFGFTAAAWQRAAQDVFQPIQERPGLWISPPRISPNGSSDASARLNLPPARLGYFNLHGILDGPDWYGQTDPHIFPDATEYPVALRPSDLEGMNGAVPSVVFSECCYGGYIHNRTAADSMALKFLAVGAQGVVGSTAVSYGSLDRPLIAADLLGRQFWDWVRSGFPAGEALRRAKIGLVREMHARQGFLDGEDQKTLISFNLYGDPLLQPIPGTHSGHFAKAAPIRPKVVKTVCDRGSTADVEEPVPAETLEYVRHVVARYLPGMEDSELAFSHERPECSGHSCPNTQIKSLAHPELPARRRVVTLSKRLNHQSRRFARLTLGEDGTLVKLVVSR